MLDQVLAEMLSELKTPESAGSPVERAAYARLAEHQNSALPALSQEWLKQAWLENELARFTYKEGWRFYIVPMMFGGHILIIRFKCIDTYHPDSAPITIEKRTPMFDAPWGDPEPFARWLAHQIQDVEIHESREWLKRDGSIYDDPHKNGA